MEIETAFPATKRRGYRYYRRGEYKTIAELIRPRSLFIGAMSGYGSIPAPTNLLKQVAGSPDVLILTMPGIGQKAVITGRVRGTEQGTVLIRRL